MGKQIERRRPRKPKKFRFSLLHSWLTNNFEPCKVADVGGGKGTLAYLLQQSGWEVVTIDPEYQLLPEKYKTFQKEKIKIKGEERESVMRITDRFAEEMVKDFDWIIGMHLHGANMQIIKACAEEGKDFLLFPCCVIDEPIEKQHGINWRDSLIEYAESLGHEVKTVQLNFKGRNIGIYTDKHLKRKESPNVEINKEILIKGDWNGN